MAFSLVWAHKGRKLWYDAELHGTWKQALRLRFYINMLKTLHFYCHILFILVHLHVYATRVNHLELGGWIDPNEPYNYLLGDLSSYSWMDYIYDWLVDFLRQFADYEYYIRKYNAYGEKCRIADELAGQSIVDALKAHQQLLYEQRCHIIREIRLEDARCSRLRLICYYLKTKCSV
jgi:hypothetical protein